jgi:hypothetical protein
MRYLCCKKLVLICRFIHAMRSASSVSLGGACIIRQAFHRRKTEEQIERVLLLVY